MDLSDAWMERFWEHVEEGLEKAMGWCPLGWTANGPLTRTWATWPSRRAATTPQPRASYMPSVTVEVAADYVTLSVAGWPPLLTYVQNV